MSDELIICSGCGRGTEACWCPDEKPEPPTSRMCVRCGQWTENPSDVLCAKCKAQS